MSASREKKDRLDDAAQGFTPRQQRQQKEEAADRRSMMLYTVTGIVVAVLAVALVVWNSGIIQRNVAAVTINGTKYSAPEVQYYMTTMLSQYGLSSSSTSLKDTIVDEETGQTMYDYFLEQVTNNLVTTTALLDKAKAEGYTLSQESQDSIDATLESFESTWASAGYQSRNAFLRANFGSYMTYKMFVSILNDQYLLQDYAAYLQEVTQYDDSDYDAYYAEHADELDSYTLTQFTFQAAVEETVDENGDTVELTDEEQAAALEEAKTAALAKAEELQAKLEAGEDAEALAEEYADDLYSSSISMVRTGASNSYGTYGVSSTYSDWAFDSARKAGDVTLADYDATSSYYYYVVRFEGRELDESATHDVRHILISGDDAEATAQDLLDQWKAGEATEDSFAALAEENSEDSGSASSGGLISAITPTSSYVESFRDWAVDASRQPGDTGLVESSYGWHIMYYVGSGDPVWKLTASDALYDQMLESLQEGYEATDGMGLRFVEV